MRVNARILAGSSIDKNWRHRNRLGGDVCGVRFRLEKGQYVSGEIPPGVVEALSRNHNVVVELMTAPVGQVKAVKPIFVATPAPIAEEPIAEEVFDEDELADLDAMLGDPVDSEPTPLIENGVQLDPQIMRRPRGRPRKNA